MRFALAAVALAMASPAGAYYDASAGRPSSKPLPTYCQMGECFVQTVEATDPVLFSPSAVLMRVESQNWQGQVSSKSLKREADTTSYVLCSKRAPATVDQTGPNAYLITFLAPNDGRSYGHSSETSMALYFTVCHARSFGSTLFEQGPVFAASVGYTVQARDD